MGVAAAVIASDEWGECLVPESPVPSDMEAAVRRVIGGTPGWLARIAPCPWLVRAQTALIDRPIAFAPSGLTDLIALAVSQDNSCRYCYGMQRTIMRIYGFTDQELDRLVRSFQVGALPPAERAAIEFSRLLTRANPRPGRPEFAAMVEAGLGRDAALEVAAVAAGHNFSNRSATLLALPTEALQLFVTRPLFRFVRPLLAWRMRPRQKPPERAPQPADGPCGRVVAALGRSPIASVLRRIIDEAWASDILPQRTKSLMLGVIGKALGCPHAVEEVRRSLAGEGFSSSDLDEVFTTLHSPRLDAREVRLVPFARETVRYQTGPIQRRVREVVQGLTPAEIIETIGIVSLANAVCRLSVILDAC